MSDQQARAVPPPAAAGAAASGGQAAAATAATQAAVTPGTAARGAGTAATTAGTEAARTRRRRDTGTAPRRRATPDRFRRWAAGLAVAATAFAVVGGAVAARVADDADRLRTSTGAVLVTAQDVRATLAEANTAQATAYLALPDDDLLSRRAYDDALERAVAQLEEVAARAGDEPDVHAAVTQANQAVTRFAGQVEAARATRLVASATANAVLAAADPGAPEEDQADADLVFTAAVTLADEHLVAAQEQLLGPVSDTVREMVAAADANFDRGGGATLPLVLGVVALGIGVVALLVVASVDVARTTRRILNLGLVAAIVAVLGATAWFGIAGLTARDRLLSAVDDAYGSIEAAAQLQETAFGLQSLAITETVVPGAEATARVDTALAAIDDDVARVVAAADGAREAALAAEVEVRLGRWLDALAVARGVADPGVRGRALRATSDPFRGFVFALDGVVADNRDQFLAGLADADAPLGVLPVGLLALGLGGAAAAALGYRPRIREYE